MPVSLAPSATQGLLRADTASRAAGRSARLDDAEVLGVLSQAGLVRATLARLHVL